MATQSAHDILSIWEISCRWNRVDPDAPGDPIPRAVADTLRRLGLVTQHSLNLFHADREPDLNDFVAGIFRGIDTSPLKRDLARCINARIYDRKVFDAAFVLKDEVEKWCLLNNYELPKFWFRGDEIAYYEGERRRKWQGRPPVDFLTEQVVGIGASPRSVEAAMTTTSGLRSEQQDRRECQRIATELWAGAPNLTIAEIIKRPELLRGGNGGLYTPKTLHRWVSEVDPRRPDQKRGRPKKNQ